MPNEMQGLSVVPLFSDLEPEQWRDALYYHFYESGWGVEKHEGVRTDRYKLIHFYDDMDYWELFDLEKDPKEIHNLYGLKDYNSVTSTLKARLADLKKEYSVPE